MKVLEGEDPERRSTESINSTEGEDPEPGAVPVMKVAEGEDPEPPVPLLIFFPCFAA